MGYEMKNDSGSLFKNDKKGDNEKAPLYKGKCVVDGVEKEIGAWMQTSKSGVTYISLKFSEPYKKDGETASSGSNDDAPF